MGLFGNTLKEKWAACYAGAVVQGGMSEKQAKRYAAELNSVRGRSAVSSYCYHPESEIDTNTLCPHGRDDRHRGSDALLGIVGTNPRLAELWLETRRGEDRAAERRRDR